MTYQLVIVKATALHQWNRQHCDPDDRPDHPVLENPWGPLHRSGRCVLARQQGLEVRTHHQYRGIHEDHHGRERRVNLM